jgi:hypothetical protein
MWVVAPEDRSMSRSALARRSSLLVFAVLLAGCAGGMGGGGDDDDGGSPFAISTTTLPVGGSGVPYSVSLEAEGGTAPYFWTLAGGSELPPGLGLASLGTIFGTPTALGTYSFEVAVTDSSATPATDTASYVLVVSAFDASIGQLHWGDAWTGESYPASAVGASGVTYTLVVNQSGGSIVDPDPVAGTATYVAGPSAGTDRIRASDGGGNVEDIDVPVRANPVGNMKANFAGTDVWHLRFEGKENFTHAFANDFDHSLATLGLRGPTSIDAEGTVADQVAWTWIRQQTLRFLNVFYRNDPDGSAAPGGLDISFPFEKPLPPHFHPADGAVNGASFNQYNVMTFLHGSLSGVLGTAYLDEPSNDSQENDTTTDDAGDLGVFTDEISSYFAVAYHNDTLPGAPIGAADVSRLKALLYGTPVSGDARYDEIKRVGEGYAKTLAAVAAHEIGHSLSLTHTSPAQSGSIMNASTVIGPGANYAFTSSDVVTLENALPGPNRGGVPATVEDDLDVAFARVAGDLSPGPDDGIVLGAPKVECGAEDACGCCVLHRRKRPARSR